MKAKSESFPKMISHSIKMDEPNQIINIYSGEFTLVMNKKFAVLNGDVFLDWFPTIRIRFKGKLLSRKTALGDIFDPTPPCELAIDNQTIGSCIITKKSIDKEVHFQGQMVDETIVGDKSIPVNKIRFAIPNLRNFHGETTVLIEDGTGKLLRNRLKFEDDNYTIILDSLPNFHKLNDSLAARGGYLFLYNGEITRKDTIIEHSDLNHVTHCLSTFMGFINGRRCAPYCLQGFFENEVIWTDYTPRKVDLFKDVFAWSLYESIEGLNELWKTFIMLWNNNSDRDFLISAIHWYLEANNNSAYIEGSIIMTQIGLELAYNWFVIEKNKLIIGKDKESISASNKIRLLLSQINIKSRLPTSFIALEAYIKENELFDGIEAFVQIRNSIVHSQEDKRKKLLDIESNVKEEALQMGLYYLELSILSILKYNGKFIHRSTGQIGIMKAKT